MLIRSATYSVRTSFEVAQKPVSDFRGQHVHYCAAGLDCVVIAICLFSYTEVGVQLRLQEHDYLTVHPRLPMHTGTFKRTARMARLMIQGKKKYTKKITLVVTQYVQELSSKR